MCFSHCKKRTRHSRAGWLLPALRNLDIWSFTFFRLLNMRRFYTITIPIHHSCTVSNSEDLTARIRTYYYPKKAQNACALFVDSLRSCHLPTCHTSTYLWVLSNFRGKSPVFPDCALPLAPLGTPILRDSGIPLTSVWVCRLINTHFFDININNFLIRYYTYKCRRSDLHVIKHEQIIGDFRAPSGSSTLGR